VFLGRKNYLFESSKVILDNYANIFDSNERKRFPIEFTLEDCIKNIEENLNFLVNFTSRTKFNKFNDYYILIYKFLSNKLDQKLFIDLDSKENDYYYLLLNLENIKLSDRINFCTKLLCN
jgi:hypothetical protein